MINLCRSCVDDPRTERSRVRLNTLGLPRTERNQKCEDATKSRHEGKEGTDENMCPFVNMGLPRNSLFFNIKY